jgi:hypothetical protein
MDTVDDRPNADYEGLAVPIEPRLRRGEGLSDLGLQVRCHARRDNICGRAGSARRQTTSLSFVRRFGSNECPPSIATRQAPDVPIRRFPV